MNLKQREKIVEDGHVRSLYGGKYDFYFDTLMIISPFIYGYFDSRMEVFDFRLIYLYLGFALFFGFSITSRIWIARINMIGNSDLERLVTILNFLESQNYIIKSKGKYYIEARLEDRPFRKGVHVLIFLLEDKLYASAWKYTRTEASKFWHYLPIYSGKDIISIIKNLNSVNKSMHSTAIAATD